MMKIAITVCALALVASSTVTMATNSGDKCEASKLKTAGKYAFCRAKAEAKAATTSTTPDYNKCDEKFSFMWGLAESTGGGMCPSNGDEAAIQAFIAEHTAAIAGALGGG